MLGYALSYTIDAEDRLVSVDDGFYSFALQNLWTGAEASIGRSLWDFVSGPEVREAQRSLLSRVRDARQQVRLPFRCDAPALRRAMAMSIEPGGPDGSIVFSTFVEEETIRAAQALIDPRYPRRGGSIEMCAWCDRFRTTSRWCEAETATRTVEALNGTGMPRIDHCLCDVCAETLATA